MDAINANRFAFNVHYFHRVDRPSDGRSVDGIALTTAKSTTNTVTTFHARMSFILEYYRKSR